MASVNSWSQLNFDVLSLILDKLTLRDAVRFGTVCHQWHILFKSKRRDLLSSPWLYIMRIDNKAVFYSIADDEYIDLLVPEPKMGSRTCIGANNGWLVTVDEACKTHLLQPLSRVQFELPPIATLPFIRARLDLEEHIKAYYNYSDVHIYRILPWPTEFFYKFCSMASVSIDLTVMINVQQWGALFFARACDSSWTALNWPEYKRYEFVDLISYKNMFYCVDNEGTVWAWVPCRSTFEPRLIATSFFHSCDAPDFREFLKDNPRFLEGTGLDPYRGGLIEGPKFLQVECDKSDEPMLVLNVPFSSTIEVVHWDKPFSTVKVVRWDKLKRTWKHVESLGDRAMFLGFNQPVSFSTNKLSELRKNCVYFSSGGGKVFCLSDKKGIRRWVGEEFSTWFTPSLV